MPVFLPGLVFGRGYGGSPFGYAPFGVGAYPRLPQPVTGGFGGSPYGYASYGSLDVIPPRVAGASSIDGYRVEVFFTEEMADEAALFDPANYSLTSVLGVGVAVASVAGGVRGEDLGGWTSVILTHTGTTLGGYAEVSASGIKDVAGNTILTTVVALYTLGDTVSAEVSFASPDDGRTVRVHFLNSVGASQNMLKAGVESLDSYSVTTEYPIPPTLSNPKVDPTDPSRVSFDLHPMTRTEYDLTLGPSLAFGYTGTTLPDDDPEFEGVELGTGTSAASSAGLYLSKALTDNYGWRFLDTSGRLAPGTTYRTDFEFSLDSATVIPGLADATFALLTISDGVIQVNLLLEDVSGMKIIRVVSGTLDRAAPANWAAPGDTLVSLVRNQQGGFYSILLNGFPVLSFPIADANGAPTHNAGCSLVLLAGLSVTLFRVSEVRITASATLYTAAWNFVHELGVVFTGSGVLARDRILTKRGPLVRGWGDATPATVKDVEVRLNGGVVPLAGVNPYVGEIYPVTPIPLAAAGTFTVEVDYIWFQNPVMEFAGLNTRGLTLNSWSRAIGTATSAQSPAPLPASSKGAAKTNRFAMSAVLAPYTRPSPKRIAHKYIGFQKSGYSALLNQPTTLLLNKNPHAFSDGALIAEALVEKGVFTGQTTPPNAETPWVLSGLDAGGVAGGGLYRVEDDTSGPYGVGDASIWYRGLDLSLTTQVTELGRFRLETWTADGVFTGVGLGIHDGGGLVLVGALEASGFKHLGYLIDGENPHLEASWVLGPGSLATATGGNTLRVSFGSFPKALSEGDRFRIASGPQAGVYTVAECGVVLVDGEVEVTFEPALPYDWTLEGGGSFEILYEVPWDEGLVSVRVLTGFPDGTCSVFIGGTIGGTLVSGVALTAYPAQTSLLLPATEKGVVFWGSVSRRALSSSLWDIVQYWSEPLRIMNTVQGITALTEMGELPQDDPNDPWYIVGGFGYSEVDATGDQVLVKSTSASDTLDFEFSYERVEPYLAPRTWVDLETRFRIESGRLGAGDAEVRFSNQQRQVALSPLLYVQGTFISPLTGLSFTGRGLVTDLPEASLSGLQAPSDAGWLTEFSSGVVGDDVRGQTIELTKPSTGTILWSKEIIDPVSVDYEGLILEARLELLTGTVGSSGGVGLVLGSSTGVREVHIGFDASGVLLLGASWVTVASFGFVWSGTGVHTYRVIIDPTANNVVLVIDDNVIGSAAYTDFPPTAYSDPQGMLGAVGDGAFAAVLHSQSVIPLRPVARAGSVLGRTFGILLKSGQDAPLNINSYRIPRNDGTRALNSSLTAVPVVMDWANNWVEARLVYDPAWGVGFFRPDLPPPPWAATSATAVLDLTEAWIAVETIELPVAAYRERGTVKFGPIDPEAITQVRYDYMRYRLRGDYDGWGLAPQNMVLNRAFTFKSGEFNLDTTPEVRTVASRSLTQVVVSDSGVYADRVFVVQVAGTVLSPTAWAFDKASQALTLTGALPSTPYPVTVTFAPGQPITKEYLCSQPIDESVTVLNAGTPPVPRSRIAPFVSSTVAGPGIYDPTDSLDPAEAGVADPYSRIEFSDPADSLYVGVEFCETEDGDDIYLSPICDGLGFAELEISGKMTSDNFEVTGKPLPSPVRGTAAAYPQASILMAGGGRATLPGSSTLNRSALYPNLPGTHSKPMGVNQELRFVLEDVREDFFGAFSDNTPPSFPDPTLSPNPDGTPSPSGLGTAVYEIVDTSASPFSRLGPWIGLAPLSQRSLLGGGAPLNGAQLTLSGGAPLPRVTARTTGVISHP